MNGTTYYEPDYARAFVESSELKSGDRESAGNISKAATSRLSASQMRLKKMQNESANEMTLMSKSGSEQQESLRDAFLKKVAPDIYLELYWKEISTGFARQLSFTLTAKDSYTAKPVSAISNVGPESSSALEILIDEAVTANLNQFISQMNGHFNTMFTIGREIVVQVGIWDSFDYDLEEEFDHEGLGMEDELGYLIEEWMALNAG